MAEDDNLDGDSQEEETTGDDEPIPGQEELENKALKDDQLEQA